MEAALSGVYKELHTKLVLSQVTRPNLGISLKFLTSPKESHGPTFE